ncbi:MAG: PAS-domain containing protein [Rhodospirillales bacterium]|nr:PAS-domain containing protein [Rhodospirillales bacterium]
MNHLEDYSRLIDGWFWETDDQNRFVYMSENVEANTGTPAKWHIGKARIDLLSRCLNDEDLSDHIEALKAHRPFYDFRYKRNGPSRECWISTSGEPFFDESGIFIGYRGVARDISNEIALSHEAETSKHRLLNALEIIDEGFVYYDKDDRLVLCNEKYREYYPKSRDLIVPGALFEDIIREGARRGEYEAAKGRIEEWVTERMALHQKANLIIEQKHSDGRWLRIAERKTPDGGIVGFRVDITELKNANLAAEKASLAKSEFLATMSHELRTPLTSIKGSLRLLEFSLKETISEKEKDLLSIGIRNSDAMLRLVNELLDYEKIISGALEIETTPHEIGELTSSVIKDNLGYARLQSVNFIFKTPEIRAFAEINEHRYEQILRNLLSNAAKFSPANSDIEIAISRLNGSVVVSVQDYGPGIPDEFKDEMFDHFTQLDSSSSRENAGTGLGLPISKALCEGMSGTIDFVTGSDVGTTFNIRFPEIGA